MGASLCHSEKGADGPSGDIVAAASQHSHLIEAELRRSKAETKPTFKILLLGSANSGKSTIAKQLRILYAHSFSESELINYRYMIHTNFIASYHHIVRGINQLNIEIQDSEKELVEKFNESYIKFLDDDDKDQIKSLLKLRSFKCVEEATRRMNEFYVPDNTAYLFLHYKRILQLQYRPTIIDVVHARASTTGMHEISFIFRKNKIRLIDVGGQRTERRKWIHCFENVSVIFFVYALSCYDEFLEEDPEKNRMDDNIELFTKIYNNDYLIQATFILFANKKDLFEQKLINVSLNKYLKEYAGANKYEPAVTYVQSLFLKCQENMDRRIHDHVTNAVDAKNIDSMFNAACSAILRHNLVRNGIN